MQKERCLKGCLKGNKNKCHSKLDLESHRFLKRQQGEILNQVQDDVFFYNNGFTLIELLVVVLIIGILAAVALPQYQVAVQRSRNAQLKTLIKSIAQAEESYKMTNGDYAREFSELDIDLPLSKRGDVCGIGKKSADSVRGNGDFSIVLNNRWGDTSVGGVVGLWQKGKYQCATISYNLNTAAWTCGELFNYSGAPGSFCQQIEKATSFTTTGEGTRIYSLP